MKQTSTPEPKVIIEEAQENTTTMRRPGENRAMHRARLSQQRRKDRRRKTDTREAVADDLTVTALHPTKGFRVVSGKRIVAQDMLRAIYQRAAMRVVTRRTEEQELLEAA